MNKKILLVEDDKFYSRIFKDGLERGGFVVESVLDGAEALVALGKEKPDLILLDLILPVKNGFDVLKEVKADEALKDIPVIILTVLEQESDKQRGLDLGAVDYLLKAEQTMSSVVEKINKYI